MVHIVSMPRRPRIYVPGFPFHVVQRGNDRRAIFFDDADRSYYLKCLVEAVELNDCAVHCYTLMGNHVHLLVTPGNRNALGNAMQSVGVRYVQYFNKRHERTGGLWDGRYRASLVNTDRYLQACYRYIESNPVRAGIVADPVAWRWSSYRFHAHGEPDPVVSAHSYYKDLARTGIKRRSRYRNWFAVTLTDDELHNIRQTTLQQLVLGDEAFKQHVETLQPHPVRVLSSGRKKIRV